MSVLLSKNFPKRLFFRFLAKAIVLLVTVGLGSYIFLEKQLRPTLETTYPEGGWGALTLTFYLVSVGAALLIFFGLLFFVYVELLVPFALFQANLSLIAEGKDPEDAEDEELLEHEENSDWTSLDKAVLHMRERIRKTEKRSERNWQMLSALLEALPEGVFAVNREGKITFFNSRFSKMIGASKEHLSGKPNLIEVVRWPQMVEGVQKCLESRTIQKGDFQLSQTDGPSISTRISIAPLQQGRSEELFGVVAVMQDVSDLKRLEQVRIDFVANVSHELRTPLTSLKGYGQTLAEDLRARRYEQGEKYVEVITRNVERLLNLSNDLLELSSLDSGVGMKTEVLDSREITEEALIQLDDHRKQKNIEIASRYDVKEVVADGMRVQQVLVNLVQNAIRYIQDGGRIEILWKPCSGGAELVVADNGPGISSDQQGRIFERFYRVDRARSRDTGGTGLGLSIVRHIMQRHGGTVRVESALGQGSKFICFFPQNQPKRPVI